MKKNILTLILAVFSTIAININLAIDIPLKDSFGNSSDILLINLILYLMLYRKCMSIKNKRLTIIASIIAIIIAISQIIGYNIANYYTIKNICLSNGTIIKSLFKCFGLAFLFEALLVVVFNKIELYEMKDSKSEKVKVLDSKKMVFVYFFVIVLCYVPYFLHYYPGICTSDSIRESIFAKNGMNQLINHHPVFHIFVIHVCFKIGSLFGKNDLYGVATYSIVQIIFTAAVFSYTLRYLTRKNVHKCIIIILLMFFALYVPFGIYSVTMWKDIPFALFMLLWIIEIFELVTNKHYFDKKRHIVKFLVIAIMTVLFRNNGIYVVVLTLLISILAMSGIRKKMLFCTIVIITFYVLYKGPIFYLCNIQDGPKKEALSIPIQQIARTVKYNRDKITDDERWRIDEYLPYYEIGDDYYELISDPVKEKFKEENFNKDKIGFIKIWGSLLTKYPGEYVDSFLCGCFGYWYPQTHNWVIANCHDEWNKEDYRYERIPIVKLDLIDYVASDINNRKIPVISSFCNIGLTFLVIFACMGYVVYRKQYKLIMIYVPIITLWLTTIASPVWCEYRYVYSAFTTLPITTIVTIYYTNKISKKRENERIIENNG